MSIPLKSFNKSMQDRWKHLGKVSNPALVAAWEDMADTFNRHVEGKINKWSVLQLPTGTGKTQGLAVYCAELAKLPKHPGVLVITKFTEEADLLSALINELTGDATAIARHSKLNASDISDTQTPVLIVTHAAYLDAMREMETDEVSVRWHKLTTWKDGKRGLTVIDETLNTVDQITISLDELRMLRGLVSYDIEEKYRDEVAAIDSVMVNFIEMAKLGQQQDVEKKFWQGIAETNLTPLTDALCKLDLPSVLLGKRGNTEKKNLLNAMRERIQELHTTLAYMSSTWSMYAKTGNYHTLNTAYVPLPPHLKNAVILDATASRNYVYTLLQQTVDLRHLPEGTRSYQNVQLHIHYGDNVGKGHLTQQSPKHFIDALRSITPAISKKKPFLFIVHKGVEDKISATIEKLYPACKIGHWGAIDGKNEWQEIDTVVLYGIQYLGKIISECAIRAYKDWYNKAQGKYDPFTKYAEGENPGDTEITIHENPEEVEDYETGHIEVSLIQAVNRIRCRAAIDKEGNCHPSTIHLFLREDGKQEQAFLDCFRTLMPEIKIIEYKDILINKADKLPKTGQKIVDFFATEKPGKYSIEAVVKATGIPRDTLDKYIALYRDGDSPFGRQMRRAGISYGSERGKYGQSSFVKI